MSFADTLRNQLDGETTAAMRDGALATFESIKRNTPGTGGTTRGVVELSDDRTRVTCRCTIWQPDGTEKVYNITVQVEESVDTHDAYWSTQLANRDGAVVIAGTHYRIKHENAPGGADCRGHDGQRFTIRFLADGHEVTTTNLWYQGPVPPKWRDRLPDTAEFVVPA